MVSKTELSIAYAAVAPSVKEACAELEYISIGEFMRSSDEQLLQNFPAASRSTISLIRGAVAEFMKEPTQSVGPKAPEPGDC